MSERFQFGDKVVISKRTNHPHEAGYTGKYLSKSAESPDYHIIYRDGASRAGLRDGTPWYVKEEYLDLVEKYQTEDGSLPEFKQEMLDILSKDKSPDELIWDITDHLTN